MDNGCKRLRKAVKVVVNPKPADPVYTVPVNVVCGNTAIAVSNYQAGINYNVRLRYSGIQGLVLDTSYVVMNTGNFIVRDINYVTHAQVDISVQAVNAITGCRSDSVQMGFIYGGHAGAPSVSTDSVTICKFDSTTLHAFYPPSLYATFHWYNAAVGGNLLFTGPDYRVSPAVTTTYYVGKASWFRSCE